MMGLIKKNEAKGVEVVWVNDDEILAVKNKWINNRNVITVITIYGELAYPKTLEEVQMVLSSRNNNFVEVDRELAINLNKVVEKDKSRGTVKLEGSDQALMVSRMGWKRYFEVEANTDPVSKEEMSKYFKQVNKIK